MSADATSTMFGFCSSNDDSFFLSLELQEVQKSLLELLKVQRGHNQKLQGKFEVELRSNGQLRVEILNKKHELKIANNQILDLTGKRNQRGALELIAGRLDSALNKGVQLKLNQLEKDPAFVHLLESVGDQHDLRKDDMLSCLKGLYQTFNKAMHGSEAMVYIRFTEVTVPAERAVLVAIFEHHQVSYMCVDEIGASVEYYTKY